ncbi:hypothetical protein BJ508DRAFT_336122 [Ascobolus immersus RN42]|uniref:Uncharacterized protein n=1 Tax=Ascobolus immersus RN42 TaxID=1160509 RepID=A0A3N4H9T2_ASCIM|nr:hypothetical protein BJ508DRAFT_336122 [Ascobolus immersus RN42]
MQINAQPLVRQKSITKTVSFTASTELGSSSTIPSSPGKLHFRKRQKVDAQDVVNEKLEEGEIHVLSPHIAPRRKALPSPRNFVPDRLVEAVRQMLSFPSDGRRRRGLRYKYMIYAIMEKLAEEPKPPWGLSKFDWGAHCHEALWRNGIRPKRNGNSKGEEEQKQREKQVSDVVVRRPVYNATPPPALK